MNNTLEVRYSMSKEIDEQQLEALFASVNWSSAAYPERLAVAMKNSDRVVTAWCDGTLVGLMNALSDGAMTAYLEAITANTSKERKAQIEEQLLAYCALDTLAMVRLWQFFSGRSATGSR